MELNTNQEILATAFDRHYDEITRQEKLWYLRTTLEGCHRNDMFVLSAWRVYEPQIDQALPALPSLHFADICNKSAPIYILRGHWRLAGILHNYIYRRWFKPYRSEIEYGRFITKFIAPKGIDRPSPATIQSIISLNKAICTEIDVRRQEYVRAVASGAVGHRFNIIDDHHNYILQPLFQALLIVLYPGDWNGEDSSSIGRLPVVLVRTGVENGLSAPITFDTIIDKVDGYIGETAIKTTVETAIDFVMDLEAREARAFGLQPDPVAAWDPDTCLHQWRDIMPYDQLIGPTSRFVDIDKYPRWLGDGHRIDTEHSVVNEQRELRQYDIWRSHGQSWHSGNDSCF